MMTHGAENDSSCSETSGFDAEDWIAMELYNTSKMVMPKLSKVRSAPTFSKSSILQTDIKIQA